jgi:hypothetical protein
MPDMLPGKRKRRGLAGVLHLIPTKCICRGSKDLILVGDIYYNPGYRASGQGKGKHNDQREITIEADPPQHVIGDGELWGETPITVKVLPRAVKFVAPTTASK